MAVSTLTLQELRDRCEDLLDNPTDLDDKTIIFALNDFLQYYQTEEMSYYPQKWRNEITISIDSNGYDLSNITDLFGTDKGFKVYKGSVSNWNQLFNIRESGKKRGWYVEGGKLYLNYLGTASSAVTLVIKYYKKTTKYSSDQSIDTTVIPVEQGMEKGVELMVCSRYLEKDQSDPQKAVNMRNDSLAEIQSFFTTNMKAATIQF